MFHYLCMCYLLFQNENEDKKLDPFPDDSFLMVSQVHWEDDVVWNGDDIKHKVSIFLLMFANSFFHFV